LWLPNIIVGGIAVYFYRKALRESPLGLQARLEQAWVFASHYFASFKRKRIA
jgi:hypothetical protein